jgi:hypothetical protein
MAGSCGTCTACCKIFPLPHLNKKANTWCVHCDVGKGCKIYETRVGACRTFECVWLVSQTREEAMPEELRPDKSKVVFSGTTNEWIIAATTMDGYPLAWREKGVRGIIKAMVIAGYTVVVGPSGSLRKTMIDMKGEREVTLSEPDENGMQWGENP